MSTNAAFEPRSPRRSHLELVESPKIASLVARQSRTNDGSMSVPDQVDMMTTWCANQTPPVHVGSIYEEPDVSGRKPLDKRKGLKQAVADVEDGRSQMILTAYFDRFVRSVATRGEVLSRVEAKGGQVYTMDMGQTSNATPVSKFTGVVLAAAAELIAEQAGEKTMVSKQRNIDNGIPPFPRITLAYQRREDGKLEPSVNAPLFREAAEQRARGVSYTKIARWLNEQGLIDPKDGEPTKITLTQVMTTLRSKLLVGEIHFGNFTPNLHAIDEPILDRSTFARINRATGTRGRYSQSDHLLARQGILVCGTCGSRMTIGHTGRADKRYPFYHCGNKLCDNPATVSARIAETFIVEETKRIAAGVVASASLDDELETARAGREAAERKLDETIRLLSETGLGDESASHEVLSDLTLRRDIAVTEHERLRSLASPALTVTVDDWDDFSLDRRREIIKAVIDRAVVAPGRGLGRIVIVERGA